MSTKPVRKSPAVISALRTLAAKETGKRRAVSLQLIAELEKPTPQLFQNEAHAALACSKCLYLPCKCGVSAPPTLDRIVALRREREQRRT